MKAFFEKKFEQIDESGFKFVFFRARSIKTTFFNTWFRTLSDDEKQKYLFNIMESRPPLTAIIFDELGEL